MHCVVGDAWEPVDGSGSSPQGCSVQAVIKDVAVRLHFAAHHAGVRTGKAEAAQSGPDWQDIVRVLPQYVNSRAVDEAG